MIPDRVRAMLDRRRSGAAGFHKQHSDNDQWLRDYEAEIDSLDPGELNNVGN